jgi:hypothetical protein
VIKSVKAKGYAKHEQLNISAYIFNRMQ